MLVVTDCDRRRGNDSCDSGERGRGEEGMVVEEEVMVIVEEEKNMMIVVIEEKVAVVT